jgi:hypothetical protein
MGSPVPLVAGQIGETQATWSSQTNSRPAFQQGGAATSMRHGAPQHTDTFFLHRYADPAYYFRTMHDSRPSVPEVTKSLRLAADLAEAAEQRAAELGLTFSDLVEAGLRRAVGWSPNAVTEFVEACADALKARYPNRQGFPQTVTLDVFREIRSDERLRALYDAAIRDSRDEVSDLARDSVHRRIGKMVKAVLDARVIGRSVPLDASVELIKTHALLVPSIEGER